MENSQSKQVDEQSQQNLSVANFGSHDSNYSPKTFLIDDRRVSIGGFLPFGAQRRMRSHSPFHYCYSISDQCLI
jgi:hypothetical protein